MWLCWLLSTSLSLVSGHVVTNVGNIKHCEWKRAERSVKDAFDDAFREQDMWSTSFAEAKNQTAVTGPSVVRWVADELLGGQDPFAETGGAVPIPWDAHFSGGTRTPQDQLQPFQYWSYTRRQLCFIVAKSLTGSGTEGYDNGLKRFLNRPGLGGCLPRKSAFGRSFWALLAACSVDPTLENGTQGPLLFVARASSEVSDKDLLQGVSLSYDLSLAKLRACRFADGGSREFAGVPPVPGQWCGPQVDFMSERGGYGQAAQVMTQKLVGGHLFGISCGLGGGQSERMAFHMPELAALAFFLSRSDWSDPQLQNPTIVLGARIVLDGLDGTAHATDYTLNSKVPMTSDLVEVQLASQSVKVSSSKPIIAFSAESQDVLGVSLNYDEMQSARVNRLMKQRQTPTFGHRVQMWYQGVALTSYAPGFRPVMQRVIKSIGVGPWGAGLSFGDSHLGFLAMWIGHATAAGTWGDAGVPPIDYYVYSTFTENPSNQCLVHSYTNCMACIAACNERKIWPAGYWLPQSAYVTGDHSKPCLTGTQHECPLRGIETMWWNWNEKSAGKLWQLVDWMVWKHRHAIKKSMFDLVMDHLVHVQSQSMTPQFPVAQTYQ